MKTVTALIPICLATAILAFSGPARASSASASCSVEIDYLVNGSSVESYTRDFVVLRDEPFVDDFSTTTREKRFVASLARDAGRWVVSIDYFNDVGVFVAISLDASLKLRSGGAIESTSGSHTYSSSQAVPAGNHTTNHTLVCHRL